jgi:TolB protein
VARGRALFTTFSGVALVALMAALVSWEMPPARAQQPTELSLEIRSGAGGSVVYAVPDFVAATPDVADIAKTLSQVLWDDLNFEREFRMLPRDVSASVARTGPGALPNFASWKELGVDALVSGTVSKMGDDIQIEFRLFNVGTQQAVLAKALKASAQKPRLLPHTISNQIFDQQRHLRGVALTKIAFVSDRNREPVIGTVEKRNAKEIYVMDYDGVNEQRITVNRNLNINPAWSPDAKALAYTSYSAAKGADIVLSHIYDGILHRPAKGIGNNYLPAISPDGTRIAFASDRSGNNEIYVANLDGSNLRRLTNNPAEDVSPTWSPSGGQIAFTSDRTGHPQVYSMNVDGTDLKLISKDGETEADRPTWSPAPYSEIALSAKHGSWYDIKVYDIAGGTSRWLTDNGVTGGSNESPAFSPTGRHLAFMSTRTGSQQIWVIGRDGKGEKQLTRTGNNQTPAWSPN